MKKIKIKLHVIDDEALMVEFEGKTMKEIKEEYGTEIEEAKYLVADGTVTEEEYNNILKALYSPKLWEEYYRKVGE